MKYTNAVLLAVSLSCPLFSADAPIPADSYAATLKENTIQQNTALFYNNARSIFHAIGPKFRLPELEGIDPAYSIEVMDFTLDQFVEKNPDLSQEMRDRISKIHKTLSNAKTNYLTCIDLVKLNEEPSTVSELALQLSKDAKTLADDPSSPSILFIGGHYLYRKGSLGGHTAAYEVVRQDDGKLSFVINQTSGKFHETTGNRMRQLVYTDLEPSDLDTDFWKNVIKTNYMNPVWGPVLMEPFYTYIDTKLLKASKNKTMGRSFKCQGGEVCAWKSLSIWLHGKIAPGAFSENRDSSNELVYTRYKKFMFEKMLANFDSEKFKETAKDPKVATVLKTELESKIQKMDAKNKKFATSPAS